MNIFDKRDWKFLWQRWTRGFDDSETWVLYMPITKFILPRLKRFKEILEHTGCIPGYIMEKFKDGYKLNQFDTIADKKIRKRQEDLAQKYWINLLQQMVDVFQDIYDEEYNYDSWRDKWNKLAKQESKKQGKDIKDWQLNNEFRKEGLKTFQENFFALWW